MVRLELTTSRSQSAHSKPTELHPEMGAEGGTRTRMIVGYQKILSLSRLPIPPPRLNITIITEIISTKKAGFNPTLLKTERGRDSVKRKILINKYIKKVEWINLLFLYLSLPRSFWTGWVQTLFLHSFHLEETIFIAN